MEVQGRNRVELAQERASQAAFFARELARLQKKEPEKPSVLKPKRAPAQRRQKTYQPSKFRPSRAALPPMPPECISTQQLINATGIIDTTLSRWIAAGIVIPFKLGKTRQGHWFDRSAIEQVKSLKREGSCCNGHPTPTDTPLLPGKRRCPACLTASRARQNAAKRARRKAP